MKRPAGRPALGLLLVFQLAAVPLTAAPPRPHHNLTLLDLRGTS